MPNARSPVSVRLLSPPAAIVEPLVRAALLEDFAHGNDLTTDAIVPPDRRASARLAARAAGVVAGTDVAATAFRLLDPGIEFDVRVRDGEPVEPGAVIAHVTGLARALLTGERTALNFLCRLSGIATLTRRFVDLVAATNARITDTRKTTPGLRVLEKYAVRCGGGTNHRFGLDDAVLIKDNHLAVAGSIAAAVEAVRRSTGHMVKVEIEVDTVEQLREALELPVDLVLLDNMTPEQLAAAVRIAGKRVVTEASGGVTPANVAAIAASGVDLISIGAITHSAPALDIALDFDA